MDEIMAYDESVPTKQVVEMIGQFNKCKTCTHLEYIAPCNVEEGIFDIGCEKHRMFTTYCEDYKDCRK